MAGPSSYDAWAKAGKPTGGVTPGNARIEVSPGGGKETISQSAGPLPKFVPSFNVKGGPMSAKAAINRRIVGGPKKSSDLPAMKINPKAPLDASTLASALSVLNAGKTNKAF